MPPLPTLPTPKWFEPRVTLGNVLSIIAMLGTVATVYTNLKLDAAQASSDIAAIQKQVDPVPGLVTDMAVVKRNQVAQQQDSDKSQDALVTRMDRSDAITNARLDRMTDSINTLAQSVAALTATIRANQAIRQ